MLFRHLSVVAGRDACSKHRPNGTYPVVIQPLSNILPSEVVDEANVETLRIEIERAGYWTTAIPIEASTGLVMDGNHRLQAARRLGLLYLPCIPLLYNDTRLHVQCWKTGDTFDIDRIWHLIATHGILPFKTTRHIFEPGLPSLKIPLLALRNVAKEGGAERI